MTAGILSRTNLSNSSTLLHGEGRPSGYPLDSSGQTVGEGRRPTIEGTDDTPFVVSDGGSDAIRSTLRRRAQHYGAYLVVALAATMLSIRAFA